MDDKMLEQLYQAQAEQVIACRGQWYLRRFLAQQSEGEAKDVNVPHAARHAVETLADAIAGSDTMADVQQYVARRSPQWPEPTASLLIALLATLEEFDAAWQMVAKRPPEGGGRNPEANRP